MWYTGKPSLRLTEQCLTGSTKAKEFVQAIPYMGSDLLFSKSDWRSKRSLKRKFACECHYAIRHQTAPGQQYSCSCNSIYPSLISSLRRATASAWRARKTPNGRCCSYKNFIMVVSVPLCWSTVLRIYTWINKFQYDLNDVLTVCFIYSSWFLMALCDAPQYLSKHPLEILAGIQQRCATWNLSPRCQLSFYSARMSTPPQPYLQLQNGGIQ